MVIKIISVLYFVGAVGLMFSGLLVPAVVFGGAAVLAWSTGEWWPLVAAFVLGWVLRLMGMDPGWKK